MSDETQNEVQPEENEQQEQEEEQTETEPSPADLAYGYAVGVKTDGTLVFELLGKEKGLVQLLGLHKYAEHQVMMAKDVNQGAGFPAVVQLLRQQSEMIKVLLNMATQHQQSGIIKP